ncbi:MAG: CBS domain-containing protein [Isosphaeraceae bacterium]
MSATCSTASTTRGRHIRRLARLGDDPEPRTCTPRDDVRDAMGKMSQFKVGQLPVVAGSEVIGMVSAGDLVRFLYDSVEAENRHLTSYLHGSY